MGDWYFCPNCHQSHSGLQSCQGWAMEQERRGLQPGPAFTSDGRPDGLDPQSWLDLPFALCSFFGCFGFGLVVWNFVGTHLPGASDNFKRQPGWPAERQPQPAHSGVRGSAGGGCARHHGACDQGGEEAQGCRAEALHRAALARAGCARARRATWWPPRRRREERRQPECAFLEVRRDAGQCCGSTSDNQ
jgi:hypothetical protein